jgi:hypothetical protein
MQTKTQEPAWVMMGGKIGEAGHCQRCGEGLLLPLPISITDFTKKVGKFSKKHAQCSPGKAPEQKIETPWDWLASRRTGISSATIWSVMVGFPSPYRAYDTPYDPADFHRCYQLLQTFPEWKSRMFDVEEKFPFWAPFVREWANLSALYEYELLGPPGRLYDCIKLLEVEANALKRGKSRWTEEDVA